MADEQEEMVTVEPKDYVTVKINHINPANVDLTFSDAIAIQHTDTEFTITFSQVQQPLIFDESGYDDLKAVDAKVVARIILTPKKLFELRVALDTNWTVFQDRIQKLRERQLKDKEPESE